MLLKVIVVKNVWFITITFLIKSLNFKIMAAMDFMNDYVVSYS